MIRCSTGAAGTTNGTVSAIVPAGALTVVETVEIDIAGVSTGHPTIV